MAHQHFQACIEACQACANACDHCAIACLQEPDVKEMARCIALDVDCAEACRMAAGYMSRDSEFANDFCQLCARLCEACGAECDRHPMDHCKECARTCRRCAEECRRMASQPKRPRPRPGAAHAH